MYIPTLARRNTSLIVRTFALLERYAEPCARSLNGYRPFVLARVAQLDLNQPPVTDHHDVYGPIATVRRLVAIVADLPVDRPFLLADSSQDAVYLLPAGEYGAAPADIAHRPELHRIEACQLVHDLCLPLEPLSNRSPCPRLLDLRALAANHRSQTIHSLVQRHLEGLAEYGQHDQRVGDLLADRLV